MTAGQRFARFVTTTVVRVPLAWKVLRRPLTHFFDTLAPVWEQRMTVERLRPLHVAFEALPAPPRTILDLGTGTGRAARDAAARWPSSEVVGADVSPAMIDEARKIGGNVRYEVADAEKLPFPDGSFELVTLSNMIPFFDELARVTAPGGHVAFAYSLGTKTPIYVPLERIRAELEKRGFEDVRTFAEGEGESLLARRYTAPRAAR